MTTPEENAATTRELIQRVLNEGDIPFADKVLSESFVELNPMPGDTGDKAGAITMFTMMREMTPDMHIEIEDVIASENKVAVRSTMTGTDTSGMPGVAPPTGKPFSMGAIDVFTYDDDGMNTGHYGVYDIAGMMMQLGHMPAPPPQG
ncbi:MAG: ester cyclase [Actinomycetota bacterium]